MSTFSTLQIEKGLKIPRERLREWIIRGFIKLSHPSPGQGIKTEFSRLDVYKVALFRNLIDFGIHRKVAKVYIEKFLPSEDEESKILYIVFRFKGDTIGAYTVEDQDNPWALALDTGQAGRYDKEGKRPFIPGPSMDGGRGISSWEHIHVVDFKNIRMKVDRQLEG
jgi:hypothetical protein